MPSPSRILTVDPQAGISRLVRAALDLSERPAVLVEVPDSRTALDEIGRGGCDLLITAWRVAEDMDGFALAAQVRQVSPQTEVIVLADASEQADRNAAGSGVVLLRRPADAGHFVQSIHAVLLGHSIPRPEAPVAPLPAAFVPDQTMFGPVPPLDSRAAGKIVDTLLADVGARAIILSTRGGDIQLERGAKGTLDRPRLAQTLCPTVTTTIGMSELVGGHVATLQYFDGDHHDIFVLSVGYHHFLSLIFDGQAGARQFGLVTRYGRRAAEDLKMMLGAAAHTLDARPSTPAAAPPVQAAAIAPQADVLEPVAVKAETWEADEPPAPEEEPAAQAEPTQAEPIPDFDVSILDGLASLDTEAADDLFDPARLAEIANEQRQGRGPLSYDEARDLGIVP